jgi:hypothetical protein
MEGRKTIVASLAALMLLGSSAAFAADVGDNQGWCKKLGPSSCSGQSECSTNHRADAPRGQAKKC